MKRVRPIWSALLAAGVLLSSAAWSAPPLPSPVLTLRPGLSALIGAQCVRQGIGPVLDCLRVGRATVSALDLEPIEWQRGTARVSGAVVFRSSVLRWLEHPATLAIAEQLSDQLSAFTSGLGEFDLFASIESTLGKTDEALDFVGALFQDISPAQAHLVWASRQDRLTAAARANVAALRILLAQLWSVVDSRSQSTVGLILYPRGLSTGLPDQWNGKIYHFYVPAVVALRLQRRGVAREQAAYGAYQFNLNYELIAQGERIGLVAVEMPLLARKDTMRDVLMGLEGALFGLTLSGVGLGSRLESSPDSLRRSMLAHIRWWYVESRDF